MRFAFKAFCQTSSLKTCLTLMKACILTLRTNFSHWCPLDAEELKKSAFNLVNFISITKRSRCPPPKCCLSFTKQNLSSLCLTVNSFHVRTQHLCANTTLEPELTCIKNDSRVSLQDQWEECDQSLQNKSRKAVLQPFTTNLEKGHIVLFSCPRLFQHFAD